MRRASFMAAVLVAAQVSAGDARVQFLARQLNGAKDPRVRAQTALLLGQTQSADAVAPLCAVLRDEEAVVRSAAASALGELRFPQAASCLRAAAQDGDPATRSAVEKALALVAGGAVATGALYLQLEPIVDKAGGLGAGLLQVAESLLRSKLSGMGAAFAPPNEDKKAAVALIKAKSLRGYQLRVQILPGSGSGLRLEMLVMTYPDQSLKGSWKVKASGGKPEAQLKALVPRLVDDAAGDLQWKH